MNRSALLLALAALLNSTHLLAMPMLSSDGTVLTEVTVEGYGIYDITFGDGVVGEIFKATIFDAQRMAEANAVSIGIVDALNVIGAGVYDIAGCNPDAFYRHCILFNPEAYVGGYFQDYDDAVGRLGFDPTWDRYTFGGELIPPGVDTTNSNRTALVTSYLWRSETVATPAPLVLILLGLSILGINRRKAV